MSKISIEATPVNISSSDGSSLGGLSLSGHLLLIYEDNNGNEFVVRGGAVSNTPPFGSIFVEQNKPILASKDARGFDANGKPITAAERGSRVLSLDNRTPENVWNLIVQQAVNITNQNFPYNPLDKNSNGTVGNLLSLVGINVDDVLPTPNFSTLTLYSGKDVDFNFDYTINGTDGDDIIVGRGASQTFYGGKGNDMLKGGEGNDTLDGGIGDDTMYGGLDNDTYFIDSLGDQAIENPNQGFDKIIIKAPLGDSSIFDFYVKNPIKRLYIELVSDRTSDPKKTKLAFSFSEGNGYFGATIAQELGSENFLEANSEDGIEFHFDGGVDSYYIDGSGFIGNNIFYGGSGNDTLFGGTGNNQLFGGDGNDTLVADIGNNILYGGSGNDLLYSGAGNDTLYGGAGKDYLRGYTGYNTLFGGEGADTFELTPGGVQIIADFEKGIDKIEAKNVAPYGYFEVLSLQQNGNDVNVVDRYGYGRLVAIVENTSVSSLSAKDFNLLNYKKVDLSNPEPEIYVADESEFTYLIIDSYSSGYGNRYNAISLYNLQNIKYLGDTIHLGDGGGKVSTDLSPINRMIYTQHDYVINAGYTPFNVTSLQAGFNLLNNSYLGYPSSIYPRFDGNDSSTIYANLIEQTYINGSGVTQRGDDIYKLSQDSPLSNAFLSAPLAYITWTSSI